MRKRLVIVVATILALGLAATGCDSGSGFEARYRVLSHTRNDVACDVEGPTIAEGDSHFRLADEKFFGVTLLAYHGCTGPEDFSCAGGGAPGGAFFGALGPIGDDQWGSDAAFNPRGTPAMCEFGYTGTRLKRAGKGRIEVRVEKHDGSRAVALCETGEGSKLTEEGRSLPCKSLEVIIAEEAD